ncbi:MAG: L-arabinose isomerase [Bacteroidales bacterium]|jgi:L-arabinose isomerase
MTNYELWFITGSQHLYGDETLKKVESNSTELVKGLSESVKSPVKIVFKAVLTTREAIRNACLEANNSKQCIGMIAWMHTFSPAKMWITGLQLLSKPFVHLHTQFNRDIPWNKIDMDFMNLNQSAHGGREFGFINTRMGIDRKIIVGHWKDMEVIRELDVWIRAAIGRYEMSFLKVARFGDNMRDVAVTEGNKVSAEIQFGFTVYGFGVGDLVKYINEVPDSSIDQTIQEYRELYKIDASLLSNPERSQALKEAARIEAGMENFLHEGGFHAFTTNFEDLHGLVQLPGLAVQRLMERGYGFGAEGDWKTAALVRTIKTMSQGMPGGTSFMEDYTYHLDPSGMKVLGAHMLEVCPSIAAGKPSLEIHPLSIGGKTDPARLIFKAVPGTALNASLMDMGNRFRLLINKVEVVDVPDLPELPVARVLWEPKPDLKISAGAWILAGGAHHTAFTQALTNQHLLDLSEMLGIECLIIDETTGLNAFKKELRFNEVYYSLVKKGIR